MSLNQSTRKLVKMIQVGSKLWTTCAIVTMSYNHGVILIKGTLAREEGLLHFNLYY